MQVKNVSREYLEKVDKYVKEVSKGKSHISASYEKELILEYKESTGRRKKEILDELLAYNITILADIALTVINNMRGGKAIDPLDLIQVGVIAFIEKIETWNPNKKAKMITYYYRDVKTKMQRFIMNNAFQVRQGSVFLQHLAYSIGKVRRKWLTKYERMPSIEELSEELNTSESTIKYCLSITSIQTLTLDNSWTMFKAHGTLEEGTSATPPAYEILNKLIKRIKGDVSNESFFEMIDYLEKKQNLSKNTLNLLKNHYHGDNKNKDLIYE